jgi:hypothetical protein
VATEWQRPDGLESRRALLRRRSAQTEKVVEFFLERETADAMISEVRKDEPALAEDLGVEAIELGLG